MKKNRTQKQAMMADDDVWMCKSKLYYNLIILTSSFLLNIQMWNIEIYENAIPILINSY